MFRDILSGSRAILVGLVFFLFVVGGSLLYSWHVHRTTHAELAETQRKVQPLENKNKTRIAQGVSVPVDIKPPGSVDTPDENTDTHKDLETGTLPNETDVLDLTDTFELNDTVPEEGPVSPFGFGPYPELPDGWPSDTFPSISPEGELIKRVEIKLIEQGTTVIGGIMEDGLVYPTIPGTVYLRWETEGNHTFISDMAGDPMACEEIEQVFETLRGDFTNSDIPSDITTLSFEEGAIDPYEFLGITAR